jgi:hypothetical protein
LILVEAVQCSLLITEREEKEKKKSPILPLYSEQALVLSVKGGILMTVWTTLWARLERILMADALALNQLLRLLVLMIILQCEALKRMECWIELEAVLPRRKLPVRRMISLVVQHCLKLKEGKKKQCEQ